MKRILLCLVASLVIATVGCGDSDGPFAITGPNPNFRVQFLNVDSGNADTLLVQAVDGNGQVVFGPLSLPAGTTFGVDLPPNSREIRVAFQDNGETICVYQALVDGTDATIDGPACIPVTDFIQSILLTPETATVEIGESRMFNLTATLVNGVTVDITNLVPPTSSNTAIATTNNAGVATGVSAGQVTIDAYVFYFHDASLLTVNAPALHGFVRIPIDFEDISETGTDLEIPGDRSDSSSENVLLQTSPVTGDTQGGSDDGATFVELPFDFTLLGDTFSGVWMSTNGYLSTGANNSEVTQFSPTAIPNTNFEGEEEGQPHNLIAPFFTDQVLYAPIIETLGRLDFSEFGHFYFEVRGTAPNRRAIFQWAVRPYDFGEEGPIGARGEDLDYCYQVKLFEGTNQMEFHYQDLTVDYDTELGPDSALIGVEDNAGTNAVTWLFEGEPAANLIQTGDALRWYP